MTLHVKPLPLRRAKLRAARSRRPPGHGELGFESLHACVLEEEG